MIAPRSPTSSLTPYPRAAINQVLNARVVEEGGRRLSGALVCARRASNKHLRLAEEKVEAGNNCHSPFRQRGGGWGSGEALIINWKGANEGFFLIATPT